ncbi:HNH endonuclease [Mobiluncus porci]|uniref:HNH endonuclease n=1 Tax=Mobiluncus porci TaxID=2652278 RepID=A0A7K0K0B0_9ACTO|nr:HNH endonuclease [Mobiluncus porci]MST48911.1 HNH endonuclease [Mobiluncus porci]
MKKNRRKFSNTILANKFSQFGGRCAYCGTPLTWERKKPNSVEFDHINPISCGGADTEENLLAACHICNYEKNDFRINEFRDYIQRLYKNNIEYPKMWFKFFKQLGVIEVKPWDGVFLFEKEGFTPNTELDGRNISDKNYWERML